jgi:hypothetical protein
MRVDEAGRLPSWVIPPSVIALGFAAAATSLANGFALDDQPIILANPRVHTLLPPWRYLQQTYWPPEIVGALYRPFAILGFSLEWRAGGGAPWLYHAVSVLLYLATILVVYRLAAELLPPAAAAITAALFAVHPVHVEAVANVVGQPEIAVALLEVAATLWFVWARRQGDLVTRDRGVIAALYLVACFTKEHGIMLPGLLLAAELTLIRDPRPVVDRLRRLVPLGGLLGLVGIAFLAGRTAVLGGLAGDAANVAIRGAGAGDRIVTMLGVIPHWCRLLWAPWHLQADYMPRELTRAAGMGPPQWLGAGLCAGLAWLGWRSREKSPVTTFGVLWVAITLFPVSNLLVPTGILLAERTLFSPSVGAMMALGGLVPLVDQRLRLAGRWARGPAIAALLVLVGAWTWRSAARAPVWRDNDTLYRQTLADAPRSYKVHWDYARLLARAGRPEEASREYGAALGLFRGDPALLAEIADARREAGSCEGAIPLYREAVMLAPEAWVSRTRLILCLARTGDLAAARTEMAVLAARGEGNATRVAQEIEEIARQLPLTRSKAP